MINYLSPNDILSLNEWQNIDQEKAGYHQLDLSNCDLLLRERGP